MSAPGCTVVIREGVNLERMAGLRTSFQNLGMVPSEWTGHSLTISADSALFGSRADVSGIAEVCLSLGKPEETFDSSTLLEMTKGLGWSPAQAVSIGGMNSSFLSHLSVGTVACEAAERLQGLVHLGTICTFKEEFETEKDYSAASKEWLEKFRATLTPDERNDFPRLFEKFDKFDGAGKDNPVVTDLFTWYHQKVREEAARRPGRVVELSHPEGPSYLVDSVYMRRWLLDPEFFLE